MKKDIKTPIDHEQIHSILCDFFSWISAETIQEQLWEVVYAAVSNPTVDTDANINGNRLLLYRNLSDLMTDLDALLDGLPLPERER